MRLILVRHGQTSCNIGDIWHGWDDCELTEMGRRQAQATAERLRTEHIDAIYSSDSRRAMQTAGAISAFHAPEPVPDRDLRERFAGEFEGVPTADVLARYPKVWEERDADFWGWRPPGGETLREVLDRAMTALARIRSAHDGQTVVAVSHMGTTRVLIAHLANIPMVKTYELPFPSTGISIFSFDGEDRPRVEALNDAGHITGL